MRKIADESEDEFVEEERKKEKVGVIAVKDDPQFTLAITRGIKIHVRQCYSNSSQ